MGNFHDELTDDLMDKIAKLKTKNDCYDFFEDLCTIPEIIDMSKRFASAKLLNKGITYKDIMKKISISTATLSRVSKSLNYGTGGYKKAINNK